MDESKLDYQCIERHIVCVGDMIKDQIESMRATQEDHVHNLSLCDQYNSEIEQLRLELQVSNFKCNIYAMNHS
jgi:hypothetical protein